MTPLCFLDTECDGVHPSRKVWEVAMIRRDDDGQRERQFFVGMDLTFSDPFDLKVGGFWDRHPAGRKMSGKDPLPCEPALSAHEAAKEVMRWTFGAHLVGAVPSFDAEVLSRLMRSKGYLPSWHYHLVDVEAMAVGYLHGKAFYELDGIPDDDPAAIATQQPVVPPWDSDELSRACGVEPASEQERHTALGDARFAMRLYDAITGTAT